MIAKDTKLLENYIACDGKTRAEIVVPVFDKVEVGDAHGDGKGDFRSQLDIDGPDVGLFDEED